MQGIKRRGPRIVPCQRGEPFTIHFCLRRFKQYLNQLKDEFLTPQLYNLVKKVEWSTESKAFFKSRKTTPLTFPLLILKAQLSTASNKADTVEWSNRNPDFYWKLNCVQLSKYMTDHKRFSERLSLQQELQRSDGNYLNRSVLLA